MLGGEGRGEGDRARYDLPCRVSRSELASGARSQESPTKHHAKLGSWGPSDALPYPAYPHPKVPGGEASGYPSCTTHPLLPSRRAAHALVPNSYPIEGGPGDRRTDQGFSNASGQWEGAGWGRVFLLMVEWVCQAPWAGLGGKSSFWGGWGEAGQAWGTTRGPGAPGWEQMRWRPSPGRWLWPRPGGRGSWWGRSSPGPGVEEAGWDSDGWGGRGPCVRAS